MKTIKIISLLMLVIASILSGCESDVADLNSFESKSKLVVLSYISPQDTMLVVRLQKTQPAIGKKLSMEELKVKNATVTISDGSSVVALTYKPASDHYEADARVWPVVAGKTYRLKVEAPGHKAEATCTIPLTTGIRITHVEAPYTIVKDYNGNDVRRYSLTFKWSDAPGVHNYYRTLAFKEYSFTDPYTGYRRVMQEGLYGSFNRNNEILTDERSLNGIMTSETIVYYEYNYNQMDKPFYLHTVLVVSDKNYYQYHRSLYSQSENNGNPFAEPVQMYSNITGGLGVFAGYN